jgi:hypothetical protein
MYFITLFYNSSCNANQSYHYDIINALDVLNHWRVQVLVVVQFVIGKHQHVNQCLDYLTVVQRERLK